MKILLLKHVKGIGQQGEVKEIKDGYAMNFIIPQKLGEPATNNTVKQLELLKKNRAVESEIHKDLLIKELEPLTGKTVEIHKKVNSAGSLFGGVTLQEIKDAITATHKVHVPTEMIHAPADLKHTGEYTIEVGDKKKLGKTFPLILKVSGQ